MKSSWDKIAFISDQIFIFTEKLNQFIIIIVIFIIIIIVILKEWYQKKNTRKNNVKLRVHFKLIKDVKRCAGDKVEHEKSNLMTPTKKAHFVSLFHQQEQKIYHFKQWNQ